VFAEGIMEIIVSTKIVGREADEKKKT